MADLPQYPPLTGVAGDDEPAHPIEAAEELDEENDPSEEPDEDA